MTNSAFKARLVLLAACSVFLAGCAIPVISTELDPKVSKRKYHRTGSHVAGASDLPRSWMDTELKYTDKDWLDLLISRQRQLSETMGNPCGSTLRCAGRRQ